MALVLKKRSENLVANNQLKPNHLFGTFLYRLAQKCATTVVGLAKRYTQIHIIHHDLGVRNGFEKGSAKE